MGGGRTGTFDCMKKKFQHVSFILSANVKLILFFI